MSVEITDVTPIERQNLPALVERAASALASAKTHAEVLEAQEMANVAYAAAKVAGRLARAKEACDSLLASVYRAQADALVIEAQAKQRLADEYDAIPEEARDKGGGNQATRSTSERVSAGALGLSRKQIHEARQIRDAERADPGIVRRTVDERVAAGEEPTKAAVREAVTELREGRAPVRGTTGTGDNEWFTPAEHIERARRVLGDFDLDPASHAVAQERVRAARFFTVEDDGLVQEWAGRVWLNPPYAQPAIAHFAAKVAEEYGAGRISAAIVLTHNYTDTAWFQGLARTAAAICFTRGRIRFEAPDGSLAAPTQGQAFFYLGSNTAAFAREFSDVGLLVFPSHAIEEANAA